MKNFNIDKLTCRFYEKDLEQEFLSYRWTKIWKNVKVLFFFDTLIGMVIRFDDIFIQGVGKAPHYLIYHFFSITLILLFIFTSNENKKRYHQYYFMVQSIGFMNCGAITYYLSEVIFPVGAGVLPILCMLYLIVFPFHFINAIIAVIGTTVPFSIVILSEGNMTIDQLAYLLAIPSIFLIVNKRAREIDFRKDFFQNKELENNRQLMQKTLKRYFGETLTKKLLDDQGDLKGDNIWVSILFTDIASYSTIIEHMSPETAVKFLNEYSLQCMMS